MLVAASDPGGRRLPDYKVGKHIEFRGIDLLDEWDLRIKLTSYCIAVPNVLCNRDGLTINH